MSFYTVFEELCRLRGDSPSHAVEQLGFTRATATFWKNGGYLPRAQSLPALSAYFAVPVSYLLDEKPPIYPCPVCGGSARSHPARHKHMLACAERYGLCWHENLCRTQLAAVRQELEESDNRPARLEAVRQALRARFSLSLKALHYPEDHIPFKEYAARLLAAHPPEEWLSAEELTYLKEAFRLPRKRSEGQCVIEPDWLGDSGLTPPVAVSDELPPPPDKAQIPVLGRIAAGHPLAAVEEIEGWIPAAYDPEEHFALRIRGDSMIGAGIPNGAIVILHIQSNAEDGQIAACLVDGEDATLKRIRREGDSLLLCAENPAYAPIRVPLKAFDMGEARILGVAVEVRSYFT